MISELMEINRRLSANLWFMTDVGNKHSGLTPRLVFPHKRKSGIRISEQEARTLYCGILNTSNYYYSIETPTVNMYQQTGKTGISASTDLSIWTFSDNNFTKKVNVEFKAHTPSIEHIQKDIEKLVKENITGNWFHTLKNIDSGTFPKLFRKFADSFISLRPLIQEADILFCFCVLDKKWTCMKHFHYKLPNSIILNDHVKSFFELEYRVKTDKIDVLESNQWSIFTI